MAVGGCVSPDASVACDLISHPPTCAWNPQIVSPAHMPALTALNLADSWGLLRGKVCFFCLFCFFSTGTTAPRSAWLSKNLPLTLLACFRLPVSASAQEDIARSLSTLTGLEALDWSFNGLVESLPFSAFPSLRRLIVISGSGLSVRHSRSARLPRCPTVAASTQPRPVCNSFSTDSPKPRPPHDNLRSQ